MRSPVRQERGPGEWWNVTTEGLETEDSRSDFARGREDVSPDLQQGMEGEGQSFESTRMEDLGFRQKSHWERQRNGGRGTVRERDPVTGEEDLQTSWEYHRNVSKQGSRVRGSTSVSLTDFVPFTQSGIIFGKQPEGNSSQIFRVEGRY